VSGRWAVGLGWLACAACGGAASPPPSRPSSAETRASDAGVSARLDPRVANALAKIDQSTFTRDLVTIAGPRHAAAAPEHLARVAQTVATELSEQGFRVTQQPVRHDGRLADNVIGDRPGEDGAHVVLVAAHYDAVRGSPGADDNASGVAALLAVARAVASVRTRSAVRLVAFAFEEDQQVGSAAYVASLARAEAERIDVAIVTDMIAYCSRDAGSQRYPAGADALVALATGRAPPTVGSFIGWVGLEDVRGPTLDVLGRAREYVPALEVLGLVIPRAAIEQVPQLLRSDHAPFWSAQIPAIAVGDTAELRNPNYHASSDTVETLDLAFAVDVVRWLVAAVLLRAGIA